MKRKYKRRVKRIKDENRFGIKVRSEVPMNPFEFSSLGNDSRTVTRCDASADGV